MAARKERARTDGTQKKDWVDFQAVKAAVTMQMVLDHYEIKGLTKSGDELRGPCPIHEDPRQSKKAFAVNVDKNAFKCFVCQARGNVLDFVAALERCSVRDAALKLQEWFKVGESQSANEEQSEDNETGIEVRRGIYKDESGGLYEVVATASRLEDLEPFVVYRELFGEFLFWVSTPATFVQTEDTDESDHLRRFTLVKAN